MSSASDSAFAGTVSAIPFSVATSMPPSSARTCLPTGEDVLGSAGDGRLSLAARADYAEAVRRSRLAWCALAAGTGCAAAQDAQHYLSNLAPATRAEPILEVSA